MIGACCTAYLATNNRYIGAILLAMSILVICMYGMSLFTAKIGYSLINKVEYIKELILSLLGNFLGVSIVAFLVKKSSLAIYQGKALNITKSILNENLTSIFILSILCGFLLYIAINNYKKVSGEIGKYICIFLSIIIIIICGLKHSIFDMYYFILSNSLSAKALLYLLVMIVGNSLGSILIAAFYNKFYKN
jgi:formate/nitrite transporter FocA (FNT family)